ncbi:MAG: class I SAM-dependent methyltransferase [Pseudomonadota bacterium]
MAELFYEQKQNRNAVTRFLHSFRYKHLTDFMARHAQPGDTVLDIGCGPGGAFGALGDFDLDYKGVDIREDFIAAAQARNPDDAGRFAVTDVTAPGFDFAGYDFVIALETFEHIPEAKLIRVIERIAQARPKHMLCSVPIEIGPSVAIKNLGARAMGYDRQSGTLGQTWHAATYNLNRLPPHGVDHLGFNWIWLEHTLRQNFQMRGARALPYGWLPKSIAPSVLFTCAPYPPGQGPGQAPGDSSGQTVGG